MDYWFDNYRQYVSISWEIFLGGIIPEIFEPRWCVRALTMLKQWFFLSYFPNIPLYFASLSWGSGP